ncbi:uncharacterized protein LOC105155274 [Sesamum indicum]|uniref:Uncharacterized protein LOC105155274 n=1 Tax=Sesamum indicum TaxID=4182 RepID=A0A6I9SK44_SESIN|nr:uncharacterized protein LOC105155274 [Sesamum indicum]
MPDLPKYDGTKDPLEHLAAFDMKFSFHFASKRKQKRSAIYLFTIRQQDNEGLKSFMGRFNNETLEVPDLKIDMMVSILIHGLKKGALASALARDPPSDVEQLMCMAQKYIDEEEMNAMKDGEWRIEHGRDRGHYDKDDRRPKYEWNKEPHYQQKYHKYTPLNTTRAKALLLVERKDVLRWPKTTRVTPAKKYSSKYCRFHHERGHDTEECYQLKDDIKRLERRAENGIVAGQNAQNNASVKGVIHIIAEGSDTGYSRRARKKIELKVGAIASRQIMNISQESDITFGAQDLKEKIGDDNDPMVIKMDIANFTVHKVLVDNGSSVDIILKKVLIKMGLGNVRLNPVNSPLVGFGRE